MKNIVLVFRDKLSKSKFEETLRKIQERFKALGWTCHDYKLEDYYSDIARAHVKPCIVFIPEDKDFGLSKTNAFDKDCYIIDVINK